MGTYQVPIELHAHNRVKLFTALRDYLESQKLPLNGFVLLQGGEEQYRYCTDDLVLFRQESYFAYLFGVKEPGFFGALDVATCRAYLFAPRLPPDYAIWSGKIQPLAYFMDIYKVDEVYYVDEIEDKLKQLNGGEKNPMLYLLYGLNTDSNNYSIPACFEGIEKFDTDLHILHPILTECRVYKSNYELDLLRHVNRISSAGHVEVMRAAKAGMKEYQLESTFLHYVYTNGGCRHVSYTCVCATGENSSVLHYGHAAAPNDRVNGIFSNDQRIIYEAVLDAQNAVISAIKPGVSWIEMHKLAELKILEALLRGGILNGDVKQMMERRLGATFMPHGLGHFLGLDTHDPGGYPQGMERSTAPGLRSLRTARRLQEGMVITVEPGCYFIEHLIDQALRDPKTSCFINRKEIERFKGFGGVRLEDDIVVTVNGCENLTKCPREIADVEAVMAGSPWPPI